MNTRRVVLSIMTLLALAIPTGASCDDSDTSTSFVVKKNNDHKFDRVLGTWRGTWESKGSEFFELDDNQHFQFNIVATFKTLSDNPKEKFMDFTLINENKRVLSKGCRGLSSKFSPGRYFFKIDKDHYFVVDTLYKDGSQKLSGTIINSKVMEKYLDSLYTYEERVRDEIESGSFTRCGNRIQFRRLQPQKRSLFHWRGR